MNIEQTAVVLIDVQGKLATIMNDSEHTVNNIEKLVKGAKVLDLPVLWLEQYPKGLGPTVPSIAAELGEQKPIEKVTFSAWKTDEFKNALIALNRKNILICGIEAHICVYQTAKDLNNAGFNVEVVTDAIDSRNEANKQLAIQRLMQDRIALTSVETALFELVEVASGDRFKQISKIVK
ncbi:hydrolase [Kurthia zopfii]|uniref:Nicotinamidase-related amidase n=1 Tax=Kurthia zopfii TaxID=1650 RepID=A0A2U3AAX1_9BACL|nr:hydrolase [Kurthia zopfii]PWI21694.1 hydrolase [Kurthia zopfii]TDR35743.1 nicotinamidase-related amidase [Kurthia zopfii]STX09928.1 putative hydrolase [Kurthia zopfii]VEI07422.1 putative hydrolase [Kurthia zopfii]GEK31216.1 hydrolase [Kurthia zopfii]